MWSESPKWGQGAALYAPRMLLQTLSSIFRSIRVSRFHRTDDVMDFAECC